MRKILPILMALIGLLGGGAAGYFLRPAPDPAQDAAQQEKAAEADGEAAAEGGEEGEPTVEYVKLNNQFVVPVVEKERVTALVILSLSLEVKTGTTEKVYSVEPKLRDSFLKVLFDHANTGGFRGSFTESRNIENLRRALLETAQLTLAKDVTNILISDIVRQDAK